MFLLFDRKEFQDLWARLSLGRKLWLLLRNWLLLNVLTFTEGCKSDARRSLHRLLEQMLPLWGSSAVCTGIQWEVRGAWQGVEVLRQY
jgi:hypothetical protein